MPVVTTKDPGRGGVGDTARGLPHRGIFKGDNVPLKWSFSIFSSIRKDGAGRGLGARPEPPPTPGPARFDRSYSGKASGFKYSRLARAGRKAFISVKPKAPNWVRARAGQKIPARRDLQGPIDHILVKPPASITLALLRRNVTVVNRDNRTVGAVKIRYFLRDVIA